LFTNKPLLIVLNKIDIKRLDELSEEKKVNFFLKFFFLLIKFLVQAIFEQFQKDDIRIIEMSTFSEEGVIEVRNEVKILPNIISINRKFLFFRLVIVY
jgi:nucleolar GTP-binding protein